MFRVDIYSLGVGRSWNRFLVSADVDGIGLFEPQKTILVSVRGFCQKKLIFSMHYIKNQLGFYL
jgi:hypothetical protein